MAFSKATLRMIGTTGMILSAIGFRLSARNVGLPLGLIGLGLLFFSALYEISFRKDTNYELFPKNGSTRTS
jgi:hypothetical protein